MLKRTLASLRTPTAKNSLKSALLTQALRRIALRESCHTIILGDNGTTIACRIVTKTSEGGGFGLPPTIALETVASNDVVFFRPLRDMLVAEMRKHAELLEIDVPADVAPGASGESDTGDGKKSIQTLALAVSFFSPHSIYVSYSHSPASHRMHPPIITTTAYDAIPARTNEAMQNVISRLGARRAIPLVDDEKDHRPSAVPRGRRRTSTMSAEVTGFQEIISKVNITYDMEKITPSTLSPSSFLDITAKAMQAQQQQQAGRSQASLHNSKSSLTEAEPSKTAGGGAAAVASKPVAPAPPPEPGQGSDADYHPPAQPVGFFRRMSVGAMELLQKLRTNSITGGLEKEMEGAQYAGQRTSTGTLLPKSYVNSIYEELEEEDEEDEDEEKDGEDEKGGSRSDDKERKSAGSLLHDETTSSSGQLPAIVTSSKPDIPLISLPVPSIDVDGASSIDEDEEDMKSTASNDNIQRQSSHWELAALTNQRKMPGGPSTMTLGTTAKVPSSVNVSAKGSAIAIMEPDNQSPNNFLGAMLSPPQSRRPSVIGSKQGALGGLTIEVPETPTLKPARSVGALSIGGHMATPEASGSGLKRRGSNASYIGTPQMVIPSSPSRSDLIKSQGYTTTKSGGIVVTGMEEGDRTADIDDDALQAEPSSPTRSRQGSIDLRDQARSRDARVSVIHQIPKLPMARGNSSASKYTEVLSRLRGNYAPPTTAAAPKIKSFGKVVQIANDLKSIGEDPALATELDSATLQMVIGLKKWARNIKAKKRQDKTKAQTLAESINLRMKTELPRTLEMDLINDAIPMIRTCVDAYKKQLGEKHNFTTGCQRHLEKLESMARDRSITLANKPSEFEEQLAANAMTINLIRKAVSRDNMNGSHVSLHKPAEGGAGAVAAELLGTLRRDDRSGSKKRAEKYLDVQPITSRD
ncbi:hypothetical protein HDU96_010911 [Phlyctochytrium bullatum]|nr:hypothetical protein HDU96_010911 [Phlyctochytrium bullatum]